ncbi:S1 family peptidase [Paenibacillus sp. FSL M7-0896]|uniref:S1 family peptidase n=1 Tax=Paenibacillus sp. FSL M7-0896 TaxID=2921610 RepID=UPI0030DD2D0C
MKKVASMIFTILLFFGGFSASNLNAEEGVNSLEDSVRLENALEKRVEFGLNNDESAKIFNDNKYISKKYGIYLSSSEEEALTKRFEQQDKLIPQIKEYFYSVPELKEKYLGLYIDQANGGEVRIIIKSQEDSLQKGTVSNVTYLAEQFEDKFNIELPISFEEGGYSEKQIEDVSMLVSENIELISQDIDIRYVTGDFIGQKVKLGITKSNIDKEYALSKISSITQQDQSLFEIEELDDDYSTVDSSRTTTTSPLQGGLAIDSSPSTSGVCSMGYSAIDANSNPYVITAAHCWYKNSGVGIYQGGNYIGYTSSLSHYGNEVDANGIRVTSNSLLSNKVYKDSNLTSVEVAGNDVLGQVVCMSGRNRGESSSCGTLQSKAHYNYWKDPNGVDVWFDSLRLATFAQSGGDSGGTVFSRGKLMGLHKGYSNDYSAYSHVTHITNRLGLTPVTW